MGMEYLMPYRYRFMQNIHNASRPFVEWLGSKYWTDAYNPFIGCAAVSPACDNCYARALVERFKINGGDFSPRRMDGAKMPKKGIVFVCNISDFCGEWVTDKDRAKMFDMCDGQAAVYLFLTKRPENMDAATARVDLPNVFLGITAENQELFDKRFAEMEKRRGSVDWVSFEPLLGSVEIGRARLAKMRWAVVGAETGRRAGRMRVTDDDWIRSIVKECRAAGVKVFVKTISRNSAFERSLKYFPPDLRIRQVPWFGKMQA